jgi:hypothetical protein
VADDVDQLLVIHVTRDLDIHVPTLNRDVRLGDTESTDAILEDLHHFVELGGRDRARRRALAGVDVRRAVEVIVTAAQVKSEDWRLVSDDHADKGTKTKQQHRQDADQHLVLLHLLLLFLRLRSPV